VALQLARAVLDKEILDCDGFKAGKVDDLLLEVRDDGPPVVRAMVTRHGALARQFGPRLTHLAARLRQLLDIVPDDAPVEIAWEHVTRIDVTVHIDLNRHDGSLMASERAVWEKWLSHLPWARR
jgi:hypothetical protein